MLKKEQIPYLCAKCGKKRSLNLSNQEFFYRTTLGWIGLAFGITYQFVWNTRLYFCASCKENLEKNKVVSRWSFILGIFFSFLALIMAIQYTMDNITLSAVFFALAVFLIILGFIFRALFQSLNAPKVIEINRQNLAIQIPTYGIYKITKGIDSQSTL